MGMNTVCQFRISDDAESWEAIVISGEGDNATPYMLSDKIVNGFLYCNARRFLRLSYLIGHLETADFSMGGVAPRTMIALDGSQGEETTESKNILPGWVLIDRPVTGYDCQPGPSNLVKVEPVPAKGVCNKGSAWESEFKGTIVNRDSGMFLDAGSYGEMSVHVFDEIWKLNDKPDQGGTPDGPYDGD